MKRKNLLAALAVGTALLTAASILLLFRDGAAAALSSIKEKTAAAFPAEQKAQSYEKELLYNAALADSKEKAKPSSTAPSAETSSIESLSASLDKLAEKERMTGFEAGQGILESTLREEAGDYAGAVLAAFKEAYWNWTFAANALQRGKGKTVIEDNLKEMLEKGETQGYGLANNGRPIDTEAAYGAVKAAFSFFNGGYEQAERLLEALPASVYIEADGFSTWLKLVCALETAKTDETRLRQARASYAAIRQRYMFLPAYWYFGARSAKGDEVSVFAERAVNLAPEGPFAEGCRALIAAWAGLPSESASAILTKNEIDSIILNAVSSQEPKALDALLPLAALPDNPYTLYTAGALRGLAQEKIFLDYLKALLRSRKSKDRLAERLAYIIGGNK